MIVDSKMLNKLKRANIILEAEVDDEQVIQALLLRVKTLEQVAEIFKDCNERKRDYLKDQESHYGFHNIDDEAVEYAEELIKESVGIVS